MKIKIKNIIKSSFVLSPIIPLSFFLSAEQNTDNQKSDIYNFNLNILAKNIQYKDSYTVIKKDINFVTSESKINDELNSLIDFLKAKEFNISISSKIEENKTNIVISNSSTKNDYIDSLFKNYSVSFEFQTNHNDEYFIESNDANIFFLTAQNDRGIYYGIQKIQDIIENSDNLAIQNFKLNDFFDIPNRAIYDDLNLSMETIKENIQISSKNGFNIYSFFDKNNPKNSEKWRELYSEKELQNIKELSNFAQKHNIDFIYNIDFFQYETINGGDNYSSDLEILKGKLKQLINIGIKSFGFVASSENNLTTDLQVKSLNDLTNWLTEIKENYDLNDNIYYFLNNSSDESIPNYVSNFNEKIKIVMTGKENHYNFNNEFIDSFNRVTSKKANIMFNTISSYNKGTIKWNIIDNNIENNFLEKLNSYIVTVSNNTQVNDFYLKQFNLKFLYNIQNKELLQKNIIKNILKVNSINDNSIQAFLETYKYIINQNQNDNFSALFDVLIQKIKNKNITESDLNELKTMFQNFDSNVKLLLNLNNDFITSLKPWLTKLSLLSNSFLNLANSIVYKSHNIISESSKNLVITEKMLNQAKTMVFSDSNIKINGEFDKFIPYLEKIIIYLKNSSEILINKDIHSVTQKFISNRGNNSNLSLGVSIENIFKKSNESVAVFDGNNNRINANEYIGSEFSSPISLNKIYLKMGGGADHFYNFVFEYLQDGEQEWKSIGDAYVSNRGNFNPITIENLNIQNVKSVRVRNLQDNSDNGWIRLFNFVINDYDEKDSIYEWFKDGVFNQTDSPNLQTHGGNSNNILDNNENTEWWITSNGSGNFAQNAAVSISYPSRRYITKVLVEQGASKESDTLTDFHIEYFDYDSNSWKQFGSYHLNNKKRQIISGIGFTDKLRIVNDVSRPIWWRLGTFVAGGEQKSLKPEFTIKSPNLQIANSETVNNESKNNLFDYITDKDDSTYALISCINDNGTIKENDYLDILFNDYREIKAVRLLQKEGNTLNHFKIQKIINNTYTDLTQEINSNNNDEISIAIPENSGKMNGIRIISTRNSLTWWALKSVDIINKEVPTNENVFVSNKNKRNNFNVLVENNKFTLLNADLSQNQTYTLESNEYIGIDFKKIYKLKQIENQLNDPNLKLFYSINGVIWTEITDANNIDTNTKARYLIIRNISEVSQEISFQKLVVYTENKIEFGKIIDTNLNSKNIDKKVEFDNNINTSRVFENPSDGKFVTYDLSKNIDIDSIKIFNSKESYDFPRFISVEVSSDKITWTKAFDISDDSINNNAKLSETTFGLNDPKYPDFKYWESSDLNLLNVRYLRLKITHNYPENKKLEINEIIINDQSSPKDEYDFNLSGTNLDSNPNLMFDKDLTTSFIPTNSNGIIKIALNSDDIKNKMVRILSENTSKNVQFKARMFNLESNSEKEILIGSLVNNLMFFNLPSNINEKIIELIIEWNDFKPNINEISFMNNSNNDSSNAKNSLREFINNQPENFDNWTDEYKDKYNEIKENSSIALNSKYLLDATFIDLQNHLNFIKNKAELVADYSPIKELIDNKITNINEFYTENSFIKYKNSITDAEKLLTKSTNINNSKLEKIKNEINSAKSQLIFSIKQKSIAYENYFIYTNLERVLYTTDSIKNLDIVATDLKKLLDTVETHPSTFLVANNSFKEKINLLKLNESGEKLKELKNILFEAEAIKKEDFKNWTTLLTHLQNEIQKTNDLIQNKNKTFSSIEEQINILHKTIKEYEKEKQKKIDSLKTHIDNNYLYLKDYFIKETFANYKQTLKNINNKINNLEISETNISNNLTEIKSSISQLKIDENYLKQQINLVKEKEVQDWLNQVYKNVNTHQQSLKFLDDLYNYQNPDFLKSINEYKDLLRKSIESIKDKSLYNSLFSNINKSYNKNSLDNLKEEIINYNKTSENKQTDKISKTNNITSIALGTTFALLSIFTLGGFLIYYWFWKKKKLK
ncbi:beta-N-acetylglucosaminidase domain-containing protein [Mycoplasma sp. 613B]